MIPQALLMMMMAQRGRSKRGRRAMSMFKSFRGMMAPGGGMGEAPESQDSSIQAMADAWTDDWALEGLGESVAERVRARSSQNVEAMEYASMSSAQRLRLRNAKNQARLASRAASRPSKMSTRTVSPPKKKGKPFDLGGFLKKGLASAGTLAGQVGVSPLMNEIKQMLDSRSELNGNILRVREVLAKDVPRIRSRKSSDATDLANSVTTHANQAIAQGNAAMRFIDAALVAMRQTDSLIMSGKLPKAQAGASYAFKRQTALLQAAPANKRLSSVIVEASQGDSALISALPTQRIAELARGAGGAAYSTASEFASKAASAAEEAGEIAETGLKATGGFLKDYMKYAPYAVVGVVVLYVGVSAAAPAVLSRRKS
jgi:hypothetical protein